MYCVALKPVMLARLSKSIMADKVFGLLFANHADSCEERPVALRIVGAKSGHWPIVGP